MLRYLIEGKLIRSSYAVVNLICYTMQWHWLAGTCLQEQNWEV